MDLALLGGTAPGMSKRIRKKASTGKGSYRIEDLKKLMQETRGVFVNSCA